VPLDAPSPDEDGLRISDRIADPAPHDPLEGLATERLAPVLHDLVDRLEPRAQQIIRLRFGLDGGESQSLQEIGDLLGLSRERVRQIEARTLEKMRSGARRCGLHTLLDGDAAAIPALAS
jgi:RNA polymerase primary sigma factor